MILAESDDFQRTGIVRMMSLDVVTTASDHRAFGIFDLAASHGLCE